MISLRVAVSSRFLMENGDYEVCIAFGADKCG